MYNEFYRFNRSPFENTPHPDFFYPSVPHREALAALLYGVKQGKGLLLITGDIGAGKTQVLRMLKSALQREHSEQKMLEISNPWLTPEEMLSLIVSDLGLDTTAEMGKNELIVAIRERLLDISSHKGRYIIAIDESQLLADSSLEAIRLLSNLESDSDKLLQIVLLGQMEMLTKLQAEANRPLMQRVTLHRTLNYLNQEQTQTYINYRMDKAGRSEPLFTEAALELIFQASNGSPRLINQLCDNCLLEGFSKRVPVIDADIVDEAIADLPQVRLGRYEVVEEPNRMLPPEPQPAPYVPAVAPAPLAPPPIPVTPPPAPAAPEAAAPSAPAAVTTAPKAPSQPGVKDNRRWLYIAGVIILILIILALLINRQPSKTNHNATSSAPRQPVREARPTIEPTYRDRERDFDYRGEAATTSLREREPVRQYRTETPAARTHNTAPADTKPAGNYDAEAELAVGNADRVPFPFNDKAVASIATVKPGWSVSQLARQHFGTWTPTMEDIVRHANPTLKDFNRIRSGDRLRLPQLSRQELITQAGGGQLHLFYGSYISRDQAQGDARQLREGGLAVVLQDGDWNGRAVTRIFLGPFADYTELQAQTRSIPLAHFAKTALAQD